MSHVFAIEAASVFLIYILKVIILVVHFHADHYPCAEFKSSSK